MPEVVATVELVEILGASYTGPAIWELDARWAVVVAVASVGEGAADVSPSLAAGARLAFAVHSPTHVFAHVCRSDDAVGGRFCFELSAIDAKTWHVVARERA